MDNNSSKEDSDRSNGSHYCWHIWRILSWCYCCGHCEHCCSRGCECYRCKHVREEVKGRGKHKDTGIGEYSRRVYL